MLLLQAAGLYYTCQYSTLKLSFLEKHYYSKCTLIGNENKWHGPDKKGLTTGNQDEVRPNIRELNSWLKAPRSSFPMTLMLNGIRASIAMAVVTRQEAPAILWAHKIQAAPVTQR